MIKICLIVLCSCGLCCSLAAQPIVWMKQMTPETGWVASRHDLFWTTTGGREWKNITPPQITGGKEISAVVFQNTLRGWIVLARFESDDERVPVRFWIASTENAGKIWSTRPLVPPDWQNLPEGVQLNISLEQVSVYFWDKLHGIVAIDGNFLLTSDGGENWRQTNSPGFGSIVFTTREDGWTRLESAKFDYSGQLFVTHDGSKSWRQVLLPGPDLQLANLFSGVPIFAGKDHGFLTVEYSGPEIQAIALFSSKDGGRTWRRDRVLPLGTAERDTVTVVGFEWRTLRLKDHKIVLSSPLTSSSVRSAPVDVNLKYLYSATFLDYLNGWALMGVDGGGPDQLLSTSNSGASWSIITPPPIRGNVVGRPPRIETEPLIWQRQF